MKEIKKQDKSKELGHARVKAYTELMSVIGKVEDTNVKFAIYKALNAYRDAYSDQVTYWLEDALKVGEKNHD